MATIKIGTFNVNNLFSRFDDPYLEGDDRYRNVVTKPKLLKQRYHLTYRILQESPDILAMQEVENKGALWEFNMGHLGGKFSHALLIEGNDSRGIDIALMSKKYPIGRVTSYQYITHPESSGYCRKVFSRDLLEVEILNKKDNSYLFTLFITHLKSKFLPWNLSGREREEKEKKNDALRRLQAETIVKIVKSRFEDLSTAGFIIAGDFNDTPGSDPLSPLLAQDNELLCYNAALEISDPGDRWTHRYAGEKNQLDYLLVSSALKNKIVKNSVHVERTKTHFDASDHHPLYIKLKF